MVRKLFQRMKEHINKPRHAMFIHSKGKGYFRFDVEIFQLQLRNHQAQVHNLRRKRKKKKLPDCFQFSQEMDLVQPVNFTIREKKQPREEELITSQTPHMVLQARRRLSHLARSLGAASVCLSDGILPIKQVQEKNNFEFFKEERVHN